MFRSLLVSIILTFAPFAATAGPTTANNIPNSWERLSRPSPGGTNDSAIRALQWNLKNTGQELTNFPDTQDINATELPFKDTGTVGIDNNAGSVWQSISDAAGVTIALLSTGVATNSTNLLPYLETGYNYCDDKQDSDDIVGRGTAIASLISTVASDDAAFSGTAPKAQIMPMVVRYNGHRNCDTEAALEKALKDLESMSPDIVVLDLGSTVVSETSLSLVRNLLTRNIWVVVALEDQEQEPETTDLLNNKLLDIEQLVVVGSYSNDGNIARFSSYENRVDLYAPGVNIYAEQPAAVDLFNYKNFSDLLTAGAQSLYVPPANDKIEITLNDEFASTYMNIVGNPTTTTTRSDWDLEGTGNMGLLSLEEYGEKWIVFDSDAFENKQNDGTSFGYAKGLRGRLSTPNFKIENSTQLRVFGTSLFAGDSDVLQILVQGKSASSESVLQEASIERLFQGEVTLQANGETEVAFAITSNIKSGSTSINSLGGAVLTGIQLWQRSAPAQSEVPLYTLQSGSHLAAAQVAGSLAKLRKKFGAFKPEIMDAHLHSTAVSSPNNFARLNMDEVLSLRAVLFPSTDEDGASNIISPLISTFGGEITISIQFFDPDNKAANAVEAELIDPTGASHTVPLDFVESPEDKIFVFQNTYTVAVTGTWSGVISAERAAGDTVNSEEFFFRVKQGTLANPEEAEVSGCGCNAAYNDGAAPYLPAVLLLVIGFIWMRKPMKEDQSA